MNTEYSIDKTTRTLIFIGKPKQLTKDSVREDDKIASTSVVIPNSISTIEEQSFKEFRSLDSVHIPNSVVFINSEAFGKCSALASIHIPNSVSSIGYEAFYGCSSLAFIHIPNSVSNTGDWAFSNCSHLHIACISINLKTYNRWASFQPKTALLRPRLKPIIFLQKKSACRASKASYSISL